jgi:hypothetical protein
MRRLQSSFFCGNCAAFVCDDCRLIAEEWEELAKNRARAVMRLEEELKKAKQDLAFANNRAGDFERMMLLGQNALLAAWINDNGPAEAVRKMEEAKKKRDERTD